MIPEYTIVEQPTRERLQSEVNELCKTGWVPCGGVALTQDGLGNIHTLVQAMTRPDYSKHEDLRNPNYKPKNPSSPIST